MDENRKRSTMEELRMIRGVLDQSATSLRGLAPLFWRMGLVWLVCACLELYIEGGSLLGFLFPGITPAFLLFGEASAAVCTGVRAALFVYLAVECVLWQRKKRSGALSDRARRLLGLWQALLLLYLALYALAAVGAWAATPPDMVISAETAEVWQTCRLLQLLPPVLFPALPPLLTGVYLGDRRLQNLGLGILALYVLSVLFSVFGTLAQVRGAASLFDTLWILLTLLALVRYLLPPVALLTVAKRLGKEPKGEEANP